ncbi:MAG: hypothetical protein K2O32_00530 [Acetatifactor sp.]|nr:hypothetical protein [Acetatifactor sp.]
MKMLLELIALILVVFFCTTVNMGMDQWRSVLVGLIDMPTLVTLVVCVLPAFLVCGMWKDFIRAVKLQKKSYTCSLNEMKRAQYAVSFLQKSLIWGGVIITLIGLMNLLLCIPADWRALGPSLYVAEIPLIYVAMLEFLLLPLEIVVKRRILEFMGEE